MSATLGPGLIDDILEGVKGLAKEYVDRLDDEYGGMGWGQRTLSNEDHAKWFYAMASQNPNWVRALPYVEGGVRELKRFRKTMGLE